MDERETFIKGEEAQRIDFNLSKSGERVLELAAIEVDRLYGVTHIRPEILLAAVVAEGSVNHILERGGTTAKKIQASLRELIKPTYITLDPNSLKDRLSAAKDRITNTTREALLSARERAKNDGRQTDPEDILFGLSHGTHSYATDVLGEVGFSWESSLASGQVATNQPIFESAKHEY